MEPFEARGRWWVPGDRARRNATGTIEYSPDTGCTLDVFGKRLDSGTSFYEPVLHGDTELGEVTLLGCTFESARQHHTSEDFAQQFSCETVLRGAHVSTDVLITHATVYVKNLDMWAELGKMEPLGPLREELNIAGAGFYHRRGSSLMARLDDSTSITLGLEVSEKLGRNEAALTARHQFHVAFAQPKVLNEVFDGYVTPLVDFLTVVTDEPSSLLSLKIVPKTENDKSQLYQLYHKVDVGIRSSPTLSVERTVTRHEQILRFGEFVFDEQLPRWFNLAHKLRGVHGLVFGLRYAANMSVENRYLNASTAAEALHRATFVVTRRKIDLENDATEQWLSQFPREERPLIKTRMNQYINDPSLGDRLQGLIDKAGGAFQKLVPIPQKWLTLVKRTRNELTHQEGVPRMRVTSDQMFLLAESLALLVTICFLIDLGYAPEDVATKLLRSFRIKALAKAMRRQLPNLYV